MKLIFIQSLKTADGSSTPILTIRMTAAPNGQVNLNE